MEELNQKGHNKNFRSFLDNMFLVFTGIYLFWQFFGTTTWFLPFPFWLNKALFVSMVGTAVLRTFYLEMDIGKGIMSPELWLPFLLSLAYGLAFLRGHYIFLLYTAVMTVGLRGIDYRKVLKTFLLSVGTGFLVTVMAGLPGIITNFVYVRAQRGVRSSWGICFPTDLASVFLFLLMALWNSWEALPDWGMLIFCTLSVLLSGKIAYSATSLFCSLLLIAAVLYHMLEIRIRSSSLLGCRIAKMTDILLEAAFPLGGAVFFACLFLYRKGVSSVYKLDTFLSARLKLASEAWDKYGVTLFGTPFEQIGGGFSSIGSSNYNFVDSTYPLLLLRYGVVLLLVLCFFWIGLTKRAISSGNRRLALTLGIIAVHSFSEHHFIEAHANVFLLLPFSAFAPELEAEKDQKKLVAAGIVGAGGALALYLSAPALLSYLKTFSEIWELTGGTGKGWYVVCLNLFLILLFEGIIYTGYRVLYLLLSGREELEKKGAEKRRQGTAYGLQRTFWGIVFFAFVLTSCIHFADRNFDSALELRQKMFREESEAIQLITEHAEGKVYADTIPVLYRNQFNGISYSFFFGEELARCPGSTVILDSDNESWCLSRSGFLYTRISDDHSVYTGDRAVIQALTDAGYSFTSYYNTKKSVKLLREAGLNRLPFSKSKGIKLSGPEDSMLYGPYLDLYGGRYTLTVRLQIPKQELTEGGSVCSLQVTTENAKNQLLEKDIAISDFDEDGKATVQIIFNTKSVRDVEFPVTAAAGRTVYVQGIEYQMTPELDTHSYYDKKMRLVREEYYNGNGQAVAQSRGYYCMEQDYDADGNISARRFYDANGNLMLRTDGYAEVRWFYDEQKQIIREAFFGTYGEPVMISGRQASNEREYDDKGNVTVFRYYGTDGLPVLTSGGYAELHRHYNEDRKVIHEEYIGIDGKPLMQQGGYTALDQEFDKSGNIIRRCFLLDGEPVLRTDGYAEVRWEYNGLRQVIKESFFDDKGEPVQLSNGAFANEREYDVAGNVIVYRYYDKEGKAANVSGYSELRRQYDERRQILRESYYGPDGKPVLLSDGYASWERDYTEEGIGRIRAQRHFGLAGEAVRTKNGCHEYRREYDDHGNMIREQYYDVDGTPVLCSDGYAVLCRTYDNKENLAEEWYLDAEGKLIQCNSGFAKITFEYDDSRRLLLTHYLDIKGNPVQAGSAYFHEYLRSLVKLHEQGKTTIFISVRDDAMDALTLPILQDMRDLGIKTELSGRTRCSYYAVISPEDVQEEIDPRKALIYEGTVDGKPFTIASAGYLVGNSSSIIIDGIQYSKNRRGMNFAVYDHAAGQVTDAVCFDTWMQEMTVIR